VDASNPVTEDSGIVIRAIADIFKYKQTQKKINVRLFGMHLFILSLYAVSHIAIVSYLEIYNETINDLLNPGKEGENLQIRESGDDGCFHFYIMGY